MTNTKAPHSILVDNLSSDNSTIGWSSQIYCNHIYSERYYPPISESQTFLGNTNWGKDDIIHYQIYASFREIQMIEPAHGSIHVYFRCHASQGYEPKGTYLLSRGNRTLSVESSPEFAAEPLLLVDLIIKNFNYPRANNFDVLKTDGTTFNANGLGYLLRLANTVRSKVTVTHKATYLGSMVGDDIYYDPQ